MPRLDGPDATRRIRQIPHAATVPIVSIEMTAAIAIINVLALYPLWRWARRRMDEFRALMQESRRSRLSHGALSWELLRDLGEPGRFELPARDVREDHTKAPRETQRALVPAVGGTPIMASAPTMAGRFLKTPMLNTLRCSERQLNR